MKRIKLLLLSALVCFGLSNALAQTKVTGQVTSSEDGQPIPGVSVLVKGLSGVGTTTNIDGNFTLNVPAAGKTLVFSYVGYQPQEVAIAGKPNFKIVLVADSKKLDEVVVTALGIKRNPKEMGVATVNVNNKELTSAGASNFTGALTARVSGLQINTVNNGINPDTKITLRGNRHFLASNQALVVLDGVPVNATYLNSINPNDVESVNVLKGASASALYGNDASNGVLIVTTKKGANRKATLKVSNITTFEAISYLPNLQTRFGSGSGETIDNADNNYTFWIGNDRNTDPYTSYENQCYGPEYNGQMVILGGKLEDGSYQMVPYSAIKNQKKDFFDIGISSQNDISYTAGDEISNMYLSGQNVETKGVVPGDRNRRSSARMAAGHKFGKFSANFSVGITNTRTSTSGGDMNQGRGVYWNVLNTPAHVPLSSYKDIINNKFATLDGYFNAYYPNPYWQIEHSRNLLIRNDVLGSASLSFKPVEWLEFSNRVGLVYNTKTSSYHVDEAIYSEYSKGDPWSQGHMGVSSPYSAEAGGYMQSTYNVTDDFMAKAEKEIGDFSAKLIAGSALYTSRVDYKYMSGTGMVIPGFYNISNRLGEASVSESLNQRRSLGVFGDVTLGYKKVAFLHASVRNDWDSRLVKENRSFFYPGVDGSIIISDILPVIKDVTPINFLKLRASWSKTGQISLSNWYATLPSYIAGSGFPYGGTAGFVTSTALSNSKLKPELTTEVEAGLEISLYNSRINFTANAYLSRTKDQTIPASISSSTGFYSAYINAGELETKGLELDLKTTPIQQATGFTWNLNFNYSYLTNKVLSIYPGLNELPIVDVSFVTVGEQFPAIRVTDVMRDPQGRIIVDKNTGLPKKNSESIIAGHGNPNHIFGIVNTLSYKGFSLNASAEYRSGNVIMNSVGSALDFTGISEHSTLNGRQPFVIPNSVIDNGDGTYTPNKDVVVTNASRAFWVSSDYHNTQRAYVTSAAFWKLREVSLSYLLSLEKFTKNSVKSVEVGVLGRNLLMFRPDTNVWTDPEFNNSDVNQNGMGYTTEDQTPPTRIYGFTVKLTF